MKRIVYDNVRPGATLKISQPIVATNLWSRRTFVAELLVEILAVENGTVTFAVVGPSEGDEA